MSTAQNPVGNSDQQVAVVLTEGGIQSVRLPRDIHFKNDTVEITRVDGGILLRDLQVRLKPTKEDLSAFWSRLDSYGADPLLPEGRAQGVFDKREIIR